LKPDNHWHLPFFFVISYFSFNGRIQWAVKKSEFEKEKAARLVRHQWHT
jgi:hypothetical protein